MSNDKRYAYYSDFGAKGDGVTDDFDALYNTHVYANENGLEVKEKIMPVSARVIVNMASMKLRRDEIDEFLEKLGNVIPKD